MLPEIKFFHSGQMAALPVVNLGTGRTATAISSMQQHVCALLDNASVKCWGSGGDGQNGQEKNHHRGNDAASNNSMTTLPGINLGTGVTATAIGTGRSHSCAILDNASVKCWGRNDKGQLGLGDTNSRGKDANTMGDNLPVVNLGTGRTATAIAGGYSHTCAILDNGAVKCWGRNNTGQLGIDSTDDIGDGSGEMGDSLATVNLGTGRTAIAIATGDLHTCVQLDNYSFKCWGDGSSGKLGIGSSADMGDASGEMATLTSIDL